MQPPFRAGAGFPLLLGVSDVAAGLSVRRDLRRHQIDPVTHRACAPRCGSPLLPPAHPIRESVRVRHRPLHSQKRPRRDEAAHTRRVTASVANESRSIHGRPGMFDYAKNADALCVPTTYRPRRRSVTEKAAVPRAEGRGLSRSRETAARGPNPLHAGQRLSHRGGRPVRRKRRPAAAVEKSR